LVVVLGFALLAGAAYAGYWYGTERAKVKEQSAKPTPVVSQPIPTPTPTPTVEDETKDWKTYTNTTYAYEFKYPSNWTVEEAKNASFLQQVTLKYEVETVESRESTDLYPFKPNVLFSVSVSISPAESLISSISHMPDFEKLADRNFANSSWQTYHYKAGKDLSTEVTSLIQDRVSRRYWISWNIATGDYKGLGDRLVGMCNQILSTFKFLD